MNPQQNSFPLPAQPKSSKKLLAVVILLVLLLVVSLVFGYWAYSGKQDATNNLDQKVAAAVASAKTAQAASLQAQFDAQSKSPNKTFTGSATYGSISFNYPKTWSAYVDTSSDSEPINAYFYPDQVPGTQSGTAYALRVELVGQAYADVLGNFQSQIQSGALTAQAYIPAKLKGVANVQAGTRLDGALTSDAKTKGSMVVLKVRDKTLEVYTQSTDFSADFNNTILPSLTFAP